MPEPGKAGNNVEVQIHSIGFGGYGGKGNAIRMK